MFNQRVQRLIREIDMYMSAGASSMAKMVYSSPVGRYLSI